MKQECYDIAQFPSVIGAVDGTLVFIRASVKDEHPICKPQRRT